LEVWRRWLVHDPGPEAGRTQSRWLAWKM
jgi:hypothetical protein